MTGRINPVRVGISLIILASVGISGYWVASHPGRTADSIDALQAKPACLDFGEVWESESFSWTVPITNRSRHDVEILDFQTSCNCAGVEPKHLTIGCGNTAEVHLNLNLASSNYREASSPIRDFTVELIPQVEIGLLKQSRWVVRGKVKNAIQVSPPVLEFWEGLLLGDPYPSKKVMVHGFVPLKEVLTDYDPSKLSIKTTRLLEKPDSWELEVVPSPTLVPGRFSAQILVQAHTLDGSHKAFKKIPVEGIVSTDIQVFPSRLLFGTKALGETAEETITISSRTGVAFELESVELPSSDTTVTRIDDPPKGCKVLRLTQRFTKEAHQSSIVKFALRQTGGLRVVIPLEVFYRGVSQ